MKRGTTRVVALPSRTLSMTHGPWRERDAVSSKQETPTETFGAAAPRRPAQIGGPGLPEASPAPSAPRLRGLRGGGS